MIFFYILKKQRVLYDIDYDFDGSHLYHVSELLDSEESTEETSSLLVVESFFFLRLLSFLPVAFLLGDWDLAFLFFDRDLSFSADSKNWLVTVSSSSSSASTSHTRYW